MSKNIFGGFEENFARGQQGQRAKNRDAGEGETPCRSGGNPGYHLGFGLGFESGYEKGYSEGSALGYNNGFLAALGLGEGDSLPFSGDNQKTCICQALHKLAASGLVGVSLAGRATEEVKALFRLIDVDAAVAGNEKE